MKRLLNFHINLSRVLEHRPVAFRFRKYGFYSEVMFLVNGILFNFSQYIHEGKILYADKRL
jgi:hypothetical protein